ncbi:MAG: glycosyltransferase [Nostocaceae cyanobacterium]|nr:glycosyltransferase [Nostocaceae cyanobacterium]
MKKVSVILPVYNEAKYIGRTCDKVLDFSQHHPDYHFIFVNDGSTDKTREIIHSKLVVLNNTSIQLISYPTNQGKGYAVKTGVQYAQGDYICFIDSDLAYSLEHLELLVDKLQYFDIVIGCRNLASDQNLQGLNFSRKLAGKIFNILSRVILNLPFTDMQAGIKGFHTDVAKELFQYQKLSQFSFDVELIYVAHKKGYKVGEIPAIVSREHKQKKTKVNIVKDSLTMFVNLWQIRYFDRVGRYE